MGECASFRIEVQHGDAIRVCPSLAALDSGAIRGFHRAGRDVVGCPEREPQWLGDRGDLVGCHPHRDHQHPRW